jgi:hypothetical protein
MTSMANVAKLAGCVETIFATAAPRTNLHPFRYWLITIDTSKYYRENLAVSIDKNLTPNLAPIGLFLFSFRG